MLRSDERNAVFAYCCVIVDPPRPFPKVKTLEIIAWPIPVILNARSE